MSAGIFTNKQNERDPPPDIFHRGGWQPAASAAGGERPPTSIVAKDGHGLGERSAAPKRARMASAVGRPTNLTHRITQRKAFAAVTIWFTRIICGLA